MEIKRFLLNGAKSIGSKCRMEEVSGTHSNSYNILLLYRNPTLPCRNALQGTAPGSSREDFGFPNLGSHQCWECPALPKYSDVHTGQ